MLSLVVAPCLIAFIWFCYFMDQRQKKSGRPSRTLASSWEMDNLNKAMSAAIVLGQLKRQRDMLNPANSFMLIIDAQIAELEKVVAAGPEKKDPYLEYGEAEVEMILL